MARRGNRRDRRIVPPDFMDQDGRKRLAARVAYAGSALHKRSPGDYALHPPINPRPWKSLCDGRRVILRAEAQSLLVDGVHAGMFSEFTGNGLPKYVWSVDGDGEAYEAKIGHDGYHGYRLEEEDDMRAVVLAEWRNRCRPG